MKVSLIKKDKENIEILLDNSFVQNSEAVYAFNDVSKNLVRRGFVQRFLESTNGRRHRLFTNKNRNYILSLY